MSDGKKFSMVVSGGGLAGSYSFNVEMAFNGVDRDELIEYAMYGRKVALQGTLRKRPDEYLAELAKKPLVVHARDAGQQVLSPQEKAEQLAKQLGIDVKMARRIVDDPTILDKLGK